jgi:uncharacterized membrane protein HdeD (DUF308 family)
MSDSYTEAVRGMSRMGVVYGIVTIILGMLAIATPMISGLAVAVVVAVVLIAAGIAQTIFAFRAGSIGEGLLTFLFGAFAVLCGLFIFARPLVGLASITMILAIYFFIDGLYGVVMSFRVKPAEGWVWLLVSAIASVVLGGFLLAKWPVSGAWAVGTLVGIRLIFSGWSMVALGGVGKAVADEVDRGTV